MTIFGASVTAIRSHPPRPAGAGLGLLGSGRGPPGLGLGHRRPLRGHPRRVRLAGRSVRCTRLRVPCSGMSAERAPERSSATSRSNVSGVWAPTKRWLTCTHGARSQSARHSASSRVMVPSAVVPPALTPSVDSACSSSSAAPLSRQAMLVHTATRWVPTGSVWSMS